MQHQSGSFPFCKYTSRDKDLEGSVSSAPIKAPVDNENKESPEFQADSLYTAQS